MSNYSLDDFNRQYSSENCHHQLSSQLVQRFQEVQKFYHLSVLGRLSKPYLPTKAAKQWLQHKPADLDLCCIEGQEKKCQAQLNGIDFTHKYWYCFSPKITTSRAISSFSALVSIHKGTLNVHSKEQLPSNNPNPTAPCLKHHPSNWTAALKPFRALLIAIVKWTIWKCIPVWKVFTNPFIFPRAEEG